MKVALLSIALLGSQLAIPVSDHVPAWNVEALCRATEATDKAMALAESQSFADCMRDETAAQQQLNALWQANSGPVRDGCEKEASLVGSPSYVDLLGCMQMAGLAEAQSPGAPLRGASKNRNTK
jgi:hypothetical protein